MAGRIPDKFIDDLLDRVDIVDVIDRRVKLKKTGKNFSACCPFHDEKTPSFSVNPEKQFYYCFGCQAGGNAIGFLMDYERLEFPEAVESLASLVGLEVPREERRPGDPAPVAANKPLLDCLEQATRFYQHNLRSHPDRAAAVTYLKARGLSGEIARDFRLGFAPAGWDNLLKALGNTEADAELLLEGGLLVKNDRERTYDRFRERIIFPILDQRGRVIAFGGRVLGDDKPKYLNSPETPVFHKSRELYGLYQARKFSPSLERVVVVEGYMDVIALFQSGITYAVATLGTSTSRTHLEKLFRLVPEVVFCFDGDAAGRKAAFRALEAALPVMEDGRQAKFLFLDEGEDPDSLVRKKGKAFLERLFDEATPLETFLFDRVAEGIDLHSLDGRARFSKLAAPFVNQLPDGVFKALMFQSLAERTGIDLDSLKRLQGPPPDLHPPEPGDADPYPGAYSGSPQGPYPGAYRDSRGPRTSVDDGPPLPEPDWIPEGAHAERLSEHSLAPDPNDPLHRLLGLITLKPALALGLAPALYEAATRPDRKLLGRLAAQVAAQPELSTPALLGYWYGTAEGALLTDLASREPLTDEAGIAALFRGLLEQLERAPQLAEARARIDKLRSANYADLSEEQKRELLALTRTIRELSRRD